MESIEVRSEGLNADLGMSLMLENMFVRLSGCRQGEQR